MGTFLKVMIGLLLTLPVAAYVAGTLVTVSSQADMPAQRTPIVISETASESSAARPGKTPSTDPKPSQDPTPQRGGNQPGRGDDDDDDDADDSRVVRPAPRDIDDDDDLDDRWDDDGDDRDDRGAKGGDDKEDDDKDGDDDGGGDD